MVVAEVRANVHTARARLRPNGHTVTQANPLIDSAERLEEKKSYHISAISLMTPASFLLSILDGL